MSSLALVQPQHLRRKAVIYVRQSTEHQVNHNIESRKLQHAMRDHAQRLGWDEQQIEIVESDTGLTGRSAAGRDAYRKLLAEVALGDVGVVVSYESARLSRNCSDWYPLLDVCAVAGCLIADRDGVYDPSSANGRLLLGMKGMLSEVELHTLRGRLLAGAQAKARRGELALTLPTGFVRLEDGRVVKDPDLAVQRAIDLVFSSFLQLKSANQVVRRLRSNRVKLPRRHRNEEVIWRECDRHMVTWILENPAYAGAFVYGRTYSVTQPGGAVVSRRYRDCSQWSVIVKDRYPAYVSWDTFERIQQILRDNYAEYERLKTRGIPRDGPAILAGLAYCGACGHKMRMQYSKGARYICNYHATKRPGDAVCQNLPVDAIDEAVVEKFFAALQPAELDLYQQAMQAHEDQVSEIDAAQQRELQRLTYEADLARRQYDRVDPDNRLVAAELERRWDEALKALRDAEQQIRDERAERNKVIALHVPQRLRESFSKLSDSLPQLWQSPMLRQAQRKALLRCLIDKVVLHRNPDSWDVACVRVVWRGGAVTPINVQVPVGAATRMSSFDDLRAKILELKDERLPDSAIARILTEQGFRTARSDSVSTEAVKRIRLQSGRRCHDQGSLLRYVAGSLTIRQIAETLGVKRSWIYNSIRRGRIDIQRDEATRLYIFPDRPETIEQLRQLKAGQLAQVKIASTQEHQGE